MALITKTNTFAGGATIIAAEHNANFDTIYNDYNGNITTANISATAAIAFSKLSLSDDVTFTGDIAFTNAATTDDAFTVNVNSLTTGDGMRVVSTSSSTSQRKILEVFNDDAGAAAASCIAVHNDASSNAVSIHADGNGPHLTFLGDPTLAPAKDGDLWFDGSALNFKSGSSTVDLMQTTKAWAHFISSGTPQIVDSYNVSSILDIGTGTYGVYWDSVFNSTAIAVVTSCRNDDGSDGFSYLSSISSADICFIKISDHEGNSKDGNPVTIIATGV